MDKKLIISVMKKEIKILENEKNDKSVDFILNKLNELEYIIQSEHDEMIKNIKKSLQTISEWSYQNIEYKSILSKEDLYICDKIIKENKNELLSE